MSVVNLQRCRIDQVKTFNINALDVLRLDLIHPVISGNKWFKLKRYLDEAIEKGCKTIITYGGAYSNHIVATASITQATGLKSIGIIRGERALRISPTLQEASDYGMQLFFVSRDEYRKKNIPEEIFSLNNRNEIYMVNEGGYGIPGAKGAADILKETDIRSYTHILAATGTGTMLAGLVMAKHSQQSVTGISVMKNNFGLVNEINQLLPEQLKNQFQLIHDFHFGGYAKFNKELIDFMNNWFDRTGIPSDFVYTAKLFYALNKMIESNHFHPDSRLLVIHSGGLQGNRSLPNGTLIF
jgi:1-aminocyclopropane-1-carboxylate deaminase